MFISESHNLVIPQHEHAIFAGKLAELRGNTDFGLPDINTNDFIQGIAEHDRGYEKFDEYNILGNYSDEYKKTSRINSINRSLEKTSSNPVIDCMVLIHVLSLSSRVPEMNNILLKRISKLKHMIDKPVNFDHIQTITNLLDNISFDVSVGEDVNEKFDVYDYKEGKLVTVTYQIIGQKVKVFPWPFKIESFKMTLLGYEIYGYPKNKVQHELEYQFISK